MKVLMRSKAISILLLIAISVSCNPYLDFRTSRLYNSIFSLSGKIDGYDVSVLSIGGMQNGDEDPLDILIRLNPSSRKFMRIEEARVLTINFYVDLLNYLNTNKKTQELLKGIKLNKNNLWIVSFFGDYDLEKHEKGDADSVRIRHAKIWSDTWGEDKNAPPESLEVVIENMLSEGKIRHPEYLKWLNAQSKD